MPWMSTSGGPPPTRTKLTLLGTVPCERTVPGSGLGLQLRHQSATAGDPGGEVVAEPAQQHRTQRLHRSHGTRDVDLALPAFDRMHESLSARVGREEAVQRPRQLAPGDFE